jgi:hypothetical protein
LSIGSQRSVLGALKLSRSGTIGISGAAGPALRALAANDNRSQYLTTYPHFWPNGNDWPRTGFCRIIADADRKN